MRWLKWLWDLIVHDEGMTWERYHRNMEINREHRRNEK